MASIDLNPLEIETVQLPEEDRNIRISDGVPEDVADDNPMLQPPGKARELQAGVRQASARSWCGKSAGDAQRRVSSVREPVGGGHAQSFDGGVRDERCGTRRVLLQKGESAVR